MKRQQEMDSGPRGKRGYTDYNNDPRDYRSQDFSRDRGPRIDSKMRDFQKIDRYQDSGDGFRSKRPRDDRGYDNYPRLEKRTFDKQGEQEFSSLAVTRADEQIPDGQLREHLFGQFKKFGEFNIKITRNQHGRVAYINFDKPEDARDAKYARQNKLYMFDKPLRIEAVYRRYHYDKPQNSRPLRSPSPVRQDTYSNRSNSPGSARNRMLSSNRDNGPRVDRKYERKEDIRDMNKFSPSDQDGRKFPHHLHHIPPEDDPEATSTLFAGNLDLDINQDELVKIFSQYGQIEDIDVKRPPRGTGNAYAFIRYLSLDDAHRAKREVSGQYIGRYECKIGYGKAIPSACLWVGGLGPWISMETLETEFDRFGVINKILWPPGRDFAFVLLGSIDAAQAAAQNMRGVALGGPDNVRLRIDFVDPKYATGEIDLNAKFGFAPKIQEEPSSSRRNNDQNGNSRDRFKDIRRSNSDRRRYDQDRRSGPKSIENESSFRSRTPEGNGDYQGSRRRSDEENHLNVPDDPSRSNDKQDVSVFDHVNTFTDFIKCLQVAWNGVLIMKNSAFPARMHIVMGDVAIVDTLMRDATSTETPMLRIAQRLRLDQPAKLEEVTRKVECSGPNNHCILIAVPSTNHSLSDATLQQRPLKNLVTYLKQKQAAGVITLPPNPTREREQGVLHAIPPSDFGQQFLLKRAPKLGIEPMNEDHIVIVVTRNQLSLGPYIRSLAAGSQLTHNTKLKALKEVLPKGGNIGTLKVIL
ncbi:unnamed protein product [Owenia fusiformis]|uniref:Uncharacterized protein n=1 Tax=Owenia fusiformis TaxID=6347 RepID=A0A8S4NME5_OWEFU|nr:unnamed protein product [Owenia fusiformis]